MVDVQPVTYALALDDVNAQVGTQPLVGLLDACPVRGEVHAFTECGSGR